MRFYLTIIAAFLAANAAFAVAPKPNTLTTKEIADGWILLFDGETTFGWTIEGQHEIKDGLLILGGAKETRATTTAGFQGFHLIFEYETRLGARKIPEFRANNPMLLPVSGEGDQSKGYRYSIYLPQDKGWTTAHYEVKAGNGSQSNHWASSNTGAGLFKFEAQSWNVPFNPTFQVQAGNTVRVRNIKLAPNGLNSLFNGKNLVGWRLYSGDPNRMKSKFAVTPEGWLNVQNGSGDLQTEAEYADFVLQGECISNGKHLNSGVFFRCLPGQYLQGYEMQILNKWQGDDRNKPIDFGTGAIYRRQPARRVTSTDGEWFTFTIAAQGRHIATWINGFPICDWTDPRPEKDNAREGAKLGKGHFSIQGHDPTTNLSFRNLRVAELKK